MIKIKLLITTVFCASLICAQNRVSADQNISLKEMKNKSGVMAVCDTNISYSDSYSSSIGAGIQTWEAGIYFDSVQTKFFGDTTWIEAIQFYINDTSVIDGLNINIYKGSVISGEALGSTLTNGVSVFDTTLANTSITEGAITILNLDSALLIDKSVGYTIFIEVVQVAAGFPMGVSDGPIVLGRGGWISLGGYQQMVEANASLDYNWIINACVSGDIIIPEHNLQLSGGIFNPTGYEKLPADQINPNGYSFETRVNNLGIIDATNVISSLSIKGDIKDTMVHGTIASSISNAQSSGVIQLDDIVGVYDVRMDCDMDSIDFNPSDNKAFGKYEITDSLYSRTSKTSFYITGEFIAGNAYDFFNNTAITKSEVNVYNSENNILPVDYPLYVALFNVDQTSGQVDPVPLAVSDTIFVPDSLSDVDNLNRVYAYDFKFTPAISVFGGQRVLAAFNNPTSGIRRFDDPEIYQTNTCFTGNFNSNDGSFTFAENAGSYYQVDIALNASRFGEDEVIDNVLENELQKIVISPNPASDKIELDKIELNSSILVLNVKGKQLYNEIAKSSNLIIDVSKYASGVYILVNKSKERVNHYKLIVK